MLANGMQTCKPCALTHGLKGMGLPTQDMPCSSTTSPVLAFTKVSSISFSGGGVPARALSQAHAWHCSTSQPCTMQVIARAPGRDTQPSHSALHMWAMYSAIKSSVACKMAWMSDNFL